ncbi:inner membrane complex protein, putative [Hepatocystis sp. ex Piliocolobus tephrosceles]|nr:inner membrane complex protein, putative [Hepatocystis sp. ex Piliocolobus tephrosceles]
MNVITSSSSQLDNCYEDLSKQYTISSNSHLSMDDLNSEYKQFYTVGDNMYDYDNRSNQSMNVNCMENSVSCIQPKPRVFIRRVSSKRKLNNKNCNSSKNDIGADINPNMVYPINSFPKTNPENVIYSIPSVNELSSEYNENYSYDGSNRMSNMNLSNDVNYSHNGSLTNLNNKFMNTPICIKEPYYGNKICDFVNQVNPMQQHGFNVNKLLSPVLPLKYSITMENTIRFIQMLLHNIMKLIKLTCRKMKNELNAKEIRVNTNVSRNNDMNISRNVYTDGYGIIAGNLKERDCISFFEEQDDINVFSRLFNLVTKWLESTDCNNVDLLKNRKNVGDLKTEYNNECSEVYYHTDSFPKDDTGKIQLPKF